MRCSALWEDPHSSSEFQHTEALLELYTAMTHTLVLYFVKILGGSKNLRIVSEYQEYVGVDLLFP